MPDLKQNTSYQDLSGAIAPMLQASKDIGASVSAARKKSKKAVDVSQYKDFLSGLGQYNGGQTGVSGSTPSTMGNVPTSVSNLGTITTPYMGSTIYEPGGANAHKGIDIGAPLGKNIPSFGEGIVTGVVTGKQHLEPGAPYGNQVIVTDPVTGDQWRYSHLNEAYVKIGSKISKGDIVGSVGISGNTYSERNPQSGGPHLDLRIYNIYKKNFVNPLNEIQS